MNTLPLQTMQELTVSFTRKKFMKYKPATVKNLLIKKNSDNNTFSNTSFMYHLIQECGIRNTVDEDVYGRAVMQTVKGYTSSKESAISIFKELTAYIKNRKDVVFHVEYPPIPLNSTFERLMFIAKYIQDPDARISDLEDILWISSRTIDDDLAKLHGYDDDPIQIAGKQFVVEDMKRENDRVSLPSTVHPLFLTSNLTEVIITLKGLKAMSNQPALKGYAIKTSNDIWEQLSKRAKDRIMEVTSELMVEDTEWFASLGTDNQHTFWPERTCSAAGRNSMMECLKNGMPCYIEYRKEDGTEKIIHVDRIERWDGNTCTIRIGKTTMELSLASVIRSATTPEELV